MQNLQHFSQTPNLYLHFIQTRLNYFSKANLLCLIIKTYTYGTIQTDCNGMGRFNLFGLFIHALDVSPAGTERDILSP